jgi:putative membrane protein
MVVAPATCPFAVNETARGGSGADRQSINAPSNPFTIPSFRRSAVPPFLWFPIPHVFPMVARRMSLLLVVIHVAANLLWIGSIVSVGFLLGQAATRPDGKAIAEVALSLYKRLAVPAFLVSFLFALGRVAVDPSYYLHLHWFHGKVTVALLAIGLHHVIGAKAKKSAAGSMQAGRNGAILSIGLFVCALAAVVLVIYQRALVP